MAEQTKIHKVGVIMHGVTGRMGTNQHLMRSIVPIIEQGGVRISDKETIMPDPVLVGRNPVKLRNRANQSGIAKWTTDPEEVLADSHYQIYFDALTTNLRAKYVRRAIDAGKHIYVEKPSATTVKEAYELYSLAEDAGIKHGVVQDKLWLPGIRKLQLLVDSGFFGEILATRGEFGYWVFEGDRIQSQRPSWNYRKEDGGGIILDMFPHWNYVFEHLFGRVKSVSCIATTHIPKRWDEEGEPYECTAEDAAFATFELNNGIIAHFNSSWVTRVRRDDLVSIQVDGTEGSAVAGLRNCYIQPYAATPKPVWNPDVETGTDYLSDWMEVPDHREYENAFKAQWELFLRHVALDEPFPMDFLSGARGVQLAEKGTESWQQGKTMEIPELEP